jgi:hypothetical protein
LRACLAGEELQVVDQQHADAVAVVAAELAPPAGAQRILADASGRLDTPRSARFHRLVSSRSRRHGSPALSGLDEPATRAMHGKKRSHEIGNQ